MPLSLLSPPANEPVDLEDIKNHLRVTSDVDDVSLAGLSVAARHALEARAGLAFLPQQWRYRASRPGPCDIILPLTPVLSIDEVGIVQSDGSYSEILPENIIADIGSIGRVRLKKPGPSTLTLFGTSFGRLEIIFTAGHNDIDSIPAELRHAIRLLTGHFYEHRASASEARVFTIPRSVDALVAPYRRVSL